jgi:death-on-curing family protein
MKKEIKKQLIIYQAKNGKIEFRGDLDKETIWGNLNQIAEVFGVQKAAISKHIKNIYDSSELEKKATVSILETVQTEGKRQIKRNIEYYNLDVIISVGYRVNSKSATQFRIWATQVLKKHLLDGYTINKKRIKQNYNSFLKTVDQIKLLLLENNSIQTRDILELINTFASTWFSLGAYDNENFPKKGLSKKKVAITSEELSEAITKLKKKLLIKKQATDIFAQERNKNSIQAIVGNVFQSVFGKDVYETIEEKAAHLLYFVVKNHPFVDGNKRTGAFSFVWFLNKTGILSVDITPTSLTALTLLIAQSNPKDKEKMIGLVLLLLEKK